MSWIQQLYETYQICAANPAFMVGETSLLPIGHTTQQAQVQITIDGQGNFLHAEVVNKETTLVPATEGSAGRTSGVAAHPLSDKIHYCAGDYASFGGQKPSYFTSYQEQLSEWCASAYSHPKARAVLTYISRKSMVADLVENRVLWVDARRCMRIAPPADHPDAEVFKVLTAKKDKNTGESIRDQGDAFVRWRVEIPGDTVPNTWEDRALENAWIDYYESKQSKRGICMVTGQETFLAEQHPAKLRHAADKAKIVSSNDTSGFTFRGRFDTADQAAGVSFEVTQKAHNALRWLIGRQGFRNGDQVIVAWAVTGQSIPNLHDDSRSLLGEDDTPSTEPPAIGDIGQNYAFRLNKAIAGYRQSIGDTTGIVILALDSATPGRIAITYYRELTGADFLARLQSWHETAAWLQNYEWNRKTKQRLIFIGVPAPRDIAEAAYGQRVDDKLSKSSVERLLPCIIDAQPVPRDLVESAVRRACNRVGQENWEWEKTLGIACALFRKHAHDLKGSYDMALENDRTTREYLYGRLLAVAENIEGHALRLADENRETNASRLMHRFADRPFDTWPILEKTLLPYKNRLRASKYAGLLFRREALLDEIMSLFQPGDFTKTEKLSGEFLLGYHCQRQALWAKKDPTEDSDEE